MFKDCLDELLVAKFVETRKLGDTPRYIPTKTELTARVVKHLSHDEQSIWLKEIEGFALPPSVLN